MEMEPLSFTPIGVIRSPHPDPTNCPVQPSAADGAEGTVEILPEFREGLADLDGFSHVILLFYCHRSRPWKARVMPYLDETERGVFATRAPSRPNAIGLSVVRLLGIEGGTLRVADLDVVDGAPLLDLKPFIPAVDHRDGPVRIGWLEGRTDTFRRARGDDRFA